MIKPQLIPIRHLFVKDLRRKIRVRALKSVHGKINVHYLLSNKSSQLALTLWLKYPFVVRLAVSDYVTV